MEHVSKRFGDFYANKDINLTVYKGEVLTLLGENGAGKSTLMNVLIGLYQPTEGSIYLNGKKVRIDSPAQAVKLGIGMVHQHFMLVEAMTVFENIILGDRNTRGLFIDREARKKEILELSARYGLDVELDRPITEIAVGAQQRVEILKALYRGAELLVLDEPSAALTDIEVEGLFKIMRKLTEEGKSVIFISHKMREVMHISDRITILRAGEVVTTLRREETDGQALANLMIGRELQGDYFRSDYDGSHSGEVLLDGKNIVTIRERDIAAFRRDHLGFVFQDFNLLDTFSLRDNIFLPLVLAGKDYEFMDARLRPLAKQLGISDILEKYPYEVSGGQKQRCAAARALITEPQIVLADEPTGALDSRSSDGLLELFGEINRDGQTILMVTHSVKAASHAGRVLFLRDGQVYHQLYRGGETQESQFRRISDTLTVLSQGGESHA